MVRRGGWKWWGVSFLSDRPRWQSGGDTAIKNSNPFQAKEVSYSVSGKVGWRRNFKLTQILRKCNEKSINYKMKLIPILLMHT